MYTFVAYYPNVAFQSLLHVMRQPAWQLARTLTQATLEIISQDLKISVSHNKTNSKGMQDYHYTTVSIHIEQNMNAGIFHCSTLNDRPISVAWIKHLSHAVITLS